MRPVPARCETGMLPRVLFGASATGGIALATDRYVITTGRHVRSLQNVFFVALHGMVTLCFRASPLHAAPDRPEERSADDQACLSRASKGWNPDARRYLGFSLSGFFSQRGGGVSSCREAHPPRYGASEGSLRHRRFRVLRLLLSSSSSARAATSASSRSRPNRSIASSSIIPSEPSPTPSGTSGFPVDSSSGRSSSAFTCLGPQPDVVRLRSVQVVSNGVRRDLD